MSDKVLVIGGTGKTGAPLVHRLIEAGIPVRSATRSGTAPAGAEGIAFDWFNANTFQSALEGVSAVYVVAPVGHNSPVDIVAPFIDQAIAGGTRRFALLSSSLLEEGGPAMGQIHTVLKERAPEWSVLRPSWFMQNFINEPHLSSICKEDSIYSATEEGQVPFIAVEDIAEVAFHALTSDTPLGQDLLLTGGNLLTYGDVADIIGKARGKPVQHVRLTVEQLASWHQKNGLGADYAMMLAGLDGLIASGAEARTTTVISEISGREPVAFAAFADQNADVWK
ncbi:ergot alkaloid biosynthesis protein [Sphingobium subterraneum]|uniref:Ergot alkaloid biosynthesis protein n=1 Tax=Sphingobium subterraneum TaxID=627688 RepID=A0A841J633_9SPHN|nr:ergot alkaloid biosynthesis protein [Sphingobium subterraneum]MBB6123671.1 ergot alkaloid biosynthesis protein [Sphingobium subterraneum]